ncbi:Peptidyl-tRNA hydrolase ArfB [subsurface metagenome]
MKKIDFDNKDFSKEFTFVTSRSSGPGGQHVNKVNTRVELRFNVIASQLLTEKEKAILQKKLQSQLTNDGDLIISSQTERSQIRNKEETIKKFYFILGEALKPQIRRIPSKPTAASRVKHQRKKQLHSKKKLLRKKPDPEE